MHVPTDYHEERISDLESSFEKFIEALEVLTSENKALHERVARLEGTVEDSSETDYIAPRAAVTRGPMLNTFTTSDFRGGRESVSD